MFDEAHKYWFVLRPPSMPTKGGLDGYLLLKNLEKYMNGALLQINRVVRDRRSVTASMNSGTKWPPRSLAKMFLDAHFYFICIGQINKFFRQLCHFLNNSKLDKLHKEFQLEFQQEIRDHLEHLDERVVGRIASGRKIVKAEPEVVNAWKQDFVNFVGDSLSFGGKQYPVNAEAGKKLRVFHERLIEVVREDYALKNPRFLRGEAQDSLGRKIERRLRVIRKNYKVRDGQGKD